MTQIEQARAGCVTPEIEAVARAEQLDPELVRDEVARGRMVIPANKTHLAKGLEPIGIGVAARTKINANIGKSAVSSDSQCELEKLILAVRCGADTVMDLSTGPQIDAVRERIIDGRHGAGGHGSNLPGGPATRRHRRHAAGGFSRRRRASGAAGRGLHDDPLRIAARAFAADPSAG